MCFFFFVGLVTTISSDEEDEIDGCCFHEDNFINLDAFVLVFVDANVAHFIEAAFAVQQHSDTTVEQLCLYSRFSYGYVSTECNVGPIINIILLELLVLIATYESLNTTGPPLVMIIGIVSLRA